MRTSYLSVFSAECASHNRISEMVHIRSDCLECGCSVWPQVHCHICAWGLCQLLGSEVSTRRLYPVVVVRGACGTVAPLVFWWRWRGRGRRGCMSMSAKVCGETSLQCAAWMLQLHCSASQLATADCTNALGQSQAWEKTCELNHVWGDIFCFMFFE